MRFPKNDSCANLREIKFMQGQSAIIANRANSKNFSNLWDAEVKVFSQFGEDGIIDYICEVIGISKPKILEIGAGNFEECNSRWLVESRNSGAYLIDGRDDLSDGVHKSGLLWKSHLFFEQTWVTPENINGIFDRATSALDCIDIFSLDVDGNDYWIIKDLDFRNTKIVIVEYNPLFGHKLSVSIPRDDSFLRSEGHQSWQYYGASIKAFIDLLELKQFSFIGTNRVGNNAFFIQNDFIGKFKLSPSDDLSIYSDWPIRDSRSPEGEMNYISGFHRINQMSEMPLVNLSTQSQISIRDILD